MKDQKKTIKYAISLAAGWAWGVSILVGMQAVQEKGVLPFIIWAVANSFALPVFGFIAFRIPNLHRVIENKLIQSFLTAIMIFCLWIQMNSIKQSLQSINGLPEIWSNIIPIAFVVVFIIVLYNNGIVRNIIIDNPLWIICYVLLVAIMIYALIRQPGFNNIELVKDKQEIGWGFSTWPILFSGPIMNIQNWQMAEKLNKEGYMRAHTWAGVIFAVYMVFVFCLSYFRFDEIMNIVFVPVILCITLSTIDAAIVGMQKIGGNIVGIILAAVSLVIWPFLADLGILNLWTFMGNARWFVALGCICAALIITYFQKRGKINEKK